MLAAVSLLTVLATAQPQEPFRVHVYSAPRGEPELVQAIERATRELASAARDEPNWFRYTENPEQAEILLYVEALSISEEGERKSYGSGMGPRPSTTTFMVASERFELQALIEILGRPEVFTGRSPTSETRAAASLFGELKAHLKENLSSVEKRRVLFRYWVEHPEHLEPARTLCDEIEREARDLDLSVVSVRWSGSTLVVATPRRTSRFPFTSARLEACLPEASCRRALVEQITDRLSR